jgi:hypothetical protein
MAVVWIEKIYNNASVPWQLLSVDTSHNGAIQGGGQQFTLDDGNYHTLSSGTKYDAQWCGIPWYYAGNHYKRVTKGGAGVEFFTAESGGAIGSSIRTSARAGQSVESR